jgi:hypothetical protein
VRGRDGSEESGCGSGIEEGVECGIGLWLAVEAELGWHAGRPVREKGKKKWAGDGWAEIIFGPKGVLGYGITFQI